MKDNFEQRKANRIQYAKDQAKKNNDEAKQHRDRADDLTQQLTPGQPVLLDHYSASKHLAHLEKIDNAMRKYFVAKDTATYYEKKAASIENNKAIFADDPQAVEKLVIQQSNLEIDQAFMKKTNACIRKRDKAAFLALSHPLVSERIWDHLQVPDELDRVGFADF